MDVWGQVKKLRKKIAILILFFIFNELAVAQVLPGNYEMPTAAVFIAPLPPTFVGGVYLLTPQLMKKVIEDKFLKSKPFFSGPVSFAPTLVTVGQYPVPTFPLVRGLLSEPVIPVGEPARVIRGVPVVTPTTFEEMYDFSITKVLESYIFPATVIVVSTEPPVDGIAAAAYAKYMHAPILLTEAEKLPELTLNALKKLKPNKIIIIGGPTAVSTKVENQLKEIAYVERIWGETRYETAVKLAEKIENPEVIVITDGTAPNTDALTISLEYNAPVVYTRGHEIPRVTWAYLLKHKTRAKPYYGAVSWIVVGLEKGTFTEIKALYSLPEVLTKHRLAVELYKIGLKLFTFSEEG